MSNVKSEKSSYSFIMNMRYHYRNLKMWQPKLYWAVVLRMLPNLIHPFLDILIPTILVKGLEEKWDIKKLGIVMGGLITLTLALNVWERCLNMQVWERGWLYRLGYQRLFFAKKMDMDYDLLEQNRYQNNQKRAEMALRQGSGVSKAVTVPNELAVYLTGALFYGILIGKESLLLVTLVILSALVNFYLLRRAGRYHDSKKEECAKIERRLDYIQKQAGDFSMGKDLRMYRMDGWLTDMFMEGVEQSNLVNGKIQGKYLIGKRADRLMIFFRDGAAYTFLIYQISQGNMSVSDFIFYTGLVSGFSLWISGFLTQAVQIERIQFDLTGIREMLDKKDGWNRGEGKPIPDKTKPVQIEFRDVSFTYPGQEEPTLSHLNLIIKKGEKLALVGVNGAGKTTFVKLLCGLYHPTEGVILLNDVPISEYNRDAYYSMVSAVFQEVYLLPVTVEQNVAAVNEEKIDRLKVRDCLKKSGLLERIDQLPQKEQTLLVKEVHETAVDLSGGEKQKLILARALYKDAPLLILDEPTAALDPIAENEIYMQYRDLSKGKTSLFISHRLSSTRFCDRIVLLNKCRIEEIGTHEELLQAGGQYANMFEVQSQYYKDNPVEESQLAV